MTDLGRLLIGLGAILLIAGAVVLLVGKAGIPLGRLPWDISYRGKNTAFYFPLASSIVVSLLLSLILYVIARLRR